MKNLADLADMNSHLCVKSDRSEGGHMLSSTLPPPPTPMTQYTKDTYISVGGRGRGCSNKTEFSFIILEICSASHQSFLVVFYRNTYVLFCAYDITVWHMASVIRPLTGFLRGQIKGSSLFSFIIVTKALFLSSYTIVTTVFVPYLLIPLCNRVECGIFFWSDRTGQITKGQAWF